MLEHAHTHICTFWHVCMYVRISASNLALTRSPATRQCCVHLCTPACASVGKRMVDCVPTAHSCIRRPVCMHACIHVLAFVHAVCLQLPVQVSLMGLYRGCSCTEESMIIVCWICKTASRQNSANSINVITNPCAHSFLPLHTHKTSAPSGMHAGSLIRPSLHP